MTNSEMDLAAKPLLTSPAETPRFEVVIAYDAPESAWRAMCLVDGLVAEFGDEFKIHGDLCRFDILALPAVREETFGAAARADLVVVAAEGGAELPAAVKDWLEDWSAARIPGTAALAAVLEKRQPPAHEPSSAHRFLQQIARPAVQEFFAREFAPSRPANGLNHEFIQTRARHPVARWGLNE